MWLGLKSWYLSSKETKDSWETDRTFGPNGAVPRFLHLLAFYDKVVALSKLNTQKVGCDEAQICPIANKNDVIVCIRGSNELALIIWISDTLFLVQAELSENALLRRWKYIGQ